MMEQIYYFPTNVHFKSKSVILYFPFKPIYDSLINPSCVYPEQPSPKGCRNWCADIQLSASHETKEVAEGRICKKSTIRRLITMTTTPWLLDWTSMIRRGNVCQSYFIEFFFFFNIQKNSLFRHFIPTLKLLKTL